VLGAHFQTTILVLVFNLSKILAQSRVVIGQCCCLFSCKCPDQLFDKQAKLFVAVECVGIGEGRACHGDSVDLQPGS
jgi:hypothetical protein